MTEIQCPYPYLIPLDKLNNPNITLTENDCTLKLETLLDPGLLIYQIVFIILWLIPLYLYTTNLYTLIKNDSKNTTNSNKKKLLSFRKNIMFYGSIGCCFSILEFLTRSERSYVTFHRFSLLCNEVVLSCFMVCYVVLLDFFVTMTKMKVKITTENGISNLEKTFYISAIFFSLVGIEIINSFGTSNGFLSFLK